MTKWAPYIEQIKSRISVSSIIEKNVKLKRSGQSIIGLCPFHDEKTPSFSVNDKKGFYHCFGCGAHGDIITYLVEKKNYSFIEAIEFLAAKAGVILPKDSASIHSFQTHQKFISILKEASEFFQETLKTSKGERARDYLKERGLKEDFIHHFQMGFASKQHSLYAHLKGKKFQDEDIFKSGLVMIGENQNPKNWFFERIIFPICNENGSIIAFGARALNQSVMPKYLNSADSDVFHKSQVLYNFHKAKDYVNNNNVFIVVEGYLDVILMAQEGIKTVVATLGTAVSEHHLNLLWKRCSRPIFCFDGDLAGYKAALRTLKMALPFIQHNKSLDFVFLPKGEDPASMICQKQTPDLVEFLRNPLSVSAFLIKEMTERLLICKTPESKVSVKKDILDMILLIKDGDIQNIYRQELYKKFNEHNRSFYHNNIKKDVYLSCEIKKKLSFDKKNDISQKILLATLINHPTLISEVYELFLHVTFDDPMWNQIRYKMLNEYQNDPEHFYEELCRINFKEHIENIDEREVYLYAPFAKPDVSMEVAKKGWMDVWHQTVWKKELKNDLKNLKDQTHINLDEHTWQKLKIVKLENLNKEERF